jgi:hypothetical protein
MTFLLQVHTFTVHRCTCHVYIYNILTLHIIVYYLLYIHVCEYVLYYTVPVHLLPVLPVPVYRYVHVVLVGGPFLRYRNKLFRKISFKNINNNLILHPRPRI